MLDLKELGKKFDELFAKETSETFERWLMEKRREEQREQITLLMGKGNWKIIDNEGLSQIRTADLGTEMSEDFSCETTSELTSEDLYYPSQAA